MVMYQRLPVIHFRWICHDAGMHTLETIRFPVKPAMFLQPGNRIFHPFSGRAKRADSRLPAYPFPDHLLPQCQSRLQQVILMVAQQQNKVVPIFFC